MSMNRRAFLHSAAVGTAALCVGARQDPAPNLEHKIAEISGKPRERGRQYGTQFKEAIHGFLNKEIYSSFIGKPNAKETMVRFAGACGGAIKDYAPLIHEEMEGMAEGSGLTFEEIVLLTNHEELWHRGVIAA